jgi:ABC-type iron transport system FetAB ATPase subunit
MEHKYIIGQTGTGKSTLMKDLALEAIHQGHGVLYMEPHGSDIDDLMPRIPYSRGKDTIEFDASDETHSISWNALQVKGNQSLVVSAFKNANK